jgi:glutamyl-tRNA synthetase
MTSSNKVVTRFAPSPTGALHVGGLRTALFAWLWARKNNGTFILRIEDTDKAREVPGSKEQIIESLKWLGVDYDEGPDIGGPNAPYLQSERLDSYKIYGQRLVDAGHAYADTFTEAEVEAFRVQAEADKKPFLFRDHRPENPPAWDGIMPLRFKTPIKAYTWHDAARGELSAGVEAVDDIILIKGDGYPTYNFAHIIDDIEMGVTHVMRGEEFIPSTPKYLAIYEAFGLAHPIYVTMPPILGPGGTKKLSKRDGAKSALDYAEEGYTSEALMNYLALLGWNPGTEKEVFTKEELIAAFDIERVQRSGAQLDEKKLNWISKEHIRMMPLEKQEELITKYLPESITTLANFSTMRVHMLVPVIMERIEKFSDVQTMSEAGELTFFFETPKLDCEKIVFKGSTEAETKEHLVKASEILFLIPEADWDLGMIKDRVMTYADTLPKRGPVLHPLRYCLSGLERSPDPFTIASIIGREETLARIAIAIALFS